MGAQQFQIFNSPSWDYGVEYEATASYAGRSTVGLSVYIRSMRVQFLPGVFGHVAKPGIAPHLQCGDCGFNFRRVHHVNVAESGLWRQSGRELPWNRTLELK